MPKSQCIHYGFTAENITELNRGIENVSFIQWVKMKKRIKTESVM
ncbi:unknown [Roseburia sp. CAG:309]|nr:unknown [Roseburia sp. CAG:309]